MKHRAVRLSDEHLRMLRTLTAMESLTISQGIRKAAILGSGGSLADAESVNRYMGARELEQEAMHGPNSLPGRAARGSVPTTDSSVVSCRMPQPWNARLSARGAFAAAVRAGILRWGAAVAGA